MTISRRLYDVAVLLSLLALVFLGPAGCGGGQRRYAIFRGKLIVVDVFKNRRGDITSVTYNGEIISRPTDITEDYPPIDIKPANYAPPGGSPLNADSTVTNSSLFEIGGEGQVSHLDRNSATAVRRLTIPENLRSLAVSPDNRFLYIVSWAPLTETGSNTTPAIRIVDLSTFTVAGSIPLTNGDRPHSIEITPDGRFAFLLKPSSLAGFNSADDATVLVVDLQRRAVAKSIRIPVTGEVRNDVVAMSPDGGLVFVITDSTITVIDVATQAVSTSTAFTTFINRPVRLAVDSTGTTLFVAPLLNGVGVFDIASAAFTGSIAVPEISSNLGMALTSDDAHLMVSTFVTDPATRTNVDALFVIDPRARRIVAEQRNRTGSRGILDHAVLLTAP